MLSTAAMAVLQEQLTERDGDNLIGAVRYVQNLEKLHHCLSRHHEISKEAWQLDHHSRISEQALRELERQGKDVKQLRANLQKEALNGGSLDPN
jgi:Na+/phosphate symporter